MASVSATTLKEEEKHDEELKMQSQIPMNSVKNPEQMEIAG